MKHKPGAIQIILLFLALAAFGDVPGTTLSVQCPHIVLSWPSTPGETFTVQHRSTLDSSTPWVTLTNLLRAAVSTNVTFYVHTNVLDCSQAASGNGTNGGGESPPSPFASQSQSRAPGLTKAERAARRQKIQEWAEESIKELMAQLEAAASQAQAARKQRAARSGQSSINEPSGSSSASMMSQAVTNTGFYRVFKTSPTARADFLAIQKNSGTNQLNILDNDTDPDDDVLLIASVTSPGHGSIGYTTTGSIFLYTPDSGFFGMDSFTYTITNRTGGRATATVRVFVNQTGNQPPSVSHPTVTLPTNTYSTTLNATTGASDPDGDTVSFVAVTTPQWGTATYGSGQIAYTHPRNYFGNDTFDYFLTDGRGGLTRVSVSVLETDADGDGMADEWEMLFGLNPASNDAHSDPDGDGLPNLAEYKLATNPRVADNPLNLDHITTGQTLSQLGRIPLALNSHIRKPAVSLLMNGNTADAFLRQGADGGWYLRWDTGYLTNGNYSIAASFQFDPDAQPPVPGRATSLEKTVRMTNEVIFDQINSGFSHTWFIDLTFAYSPAEWRIELYDEDGSGLVYFDGTSTSGKVQGGWDLTAGGGQISFGNILAYVYAAPAGQTLPPVGSTIGAKANRWFTKEIPGGIGDKFVLAWGWDIYNATYAQQRENLMLNGVINIIGDPSSFNEYLLLPDLNIPYGSAFRYDTGEDREILLNALKSPDAGNFFWFGHGATDAIQGNAKKSSIGPDDIEFALENKKHRSQPPKFSRKNKHPYRLVILNGCSTYGSGWANAFGIDYAPGGTTNITLEYFYTGRTPQAFVGWTVDTLGPPNLDPAGGSHAAYALALGQLFSGWMSGQPLDICLETFGETATNLGFTGQDKWRISGCEDLRRNGP